MNVVGKVVRAAFLISLCASLESSGVPQSRAQAATNEAATKLREPLAIAFIEAPKVAAGDPARRFPLGSRLLRLNLEAGREGSVVPLAPQFFAAADPEVSSDARSLLFAAQTQPTTPWQIWEISADGGTPRQITHCAGDCVQPAYLPRHEIAYTFLQGTPRTSEVQISRTDGTAAHPITFGPGQFELETVLSSGRLLLSAASPLIEASGAGQRRSLYLIDPDGSGLMLLPQQDAARSNRSDARELPDGTILFTQRNTAQSQNGQLAWVRPGALHATPMADARNVDSSAQALGEATMVVSRRTAAGSFALYQFSMNNSGREQLLHNSPHASSVQPVLIAAHPAALTYRSILHPERNAGRMVCLDAYASRDFANGRLPGHIARVRVLALAQNGETLLGEAPVESDGSFYATVPANLPIRPLLIGAHGEILKQQRSWIWVRNGEDRGCPGCHESPALAPENRSPRTLQRFDTPTALTGELVAVPPSRKAARP